MINFNSLHRSNLRCWLTYIIVSFVILATAVIGGFYIAKPHLDNFVKREITRRFIRAKTSEVSILGKVNLTNVIVPVPASMSLKIGTISARPPISFIPGTFTLYDVDLKLNNLHVQIPKLHLNGVSLKEKDPTVLPPILQSIMRIGLASIVAQDILLSMKNGNKLTEKVRIRDFRLFDFKNGRIGSVDIKNMELAMTTASGNKQVHLVSKSNVIKAYNVDIIHIYSSVFKKGNSTNQKEIITGPISFDDFIINIFEETEKIVSLSLGKFKTSGLKMKPFEQYPERLIKDYLDARKKNNRMAEKTARNALLINILPTIASVDIKVDKATINTPKFEATLDAFYFEPSLWEQPIPKKISLYLSNFSILPKNIRKKDLNFFEKIISDRLDFSGELDVSYDEKKRMFSLNAMSFNVKDIGFGKISAQFVDVDKKLFSGQKDATISTFENLGITKIDIRYTDVGFIDKLFSYLAQKLNDGRHDLKQELYDYFYLIMMQSPRMLLKNHENTEAISKSFGDFAKNPKTLAIKITAKDNKGLTIDDFKTTLHKGLSAILSKVTLTVQNESSP
ncbi:hypothetical protein [Bartonella sp. B41]